MKVRQTLLAAGLALMAVTVLSCGIKTDLRPPKSGEPGAVKNLDGHWEGSEVVLQGGLPPDEESGRESSRISGARVYHVWFDPNETPCEGCPISFPGYQEAALDKVEKGRFQCRISAEPKAGTHFFQVRLVGSGEALGPPSNRVKLTVQAR